MSAKIHHFDFSESALNEIRDRSHCRDWPVVYLINNNKEIYVGETTNVSRRASEHFQNNERRRLEKIHIIDDDTFNKSAIQDLEAFLIENMSADGKFTLQNGNRGLRQHNYYQRKLYTNNFKEIWSQLRSLGLVIHSLQTIRNSDVFKYSPYKSLSEDQDRILDKLLSDLQEDFSKGKDTTYIVRGGAGTGKTVLAIYLIKLLTEINHYDEVIATEEPERNSILDSIYSNCAKLRIGLVIPMVSLNRTLKKVFRKIDGLSPDLVLSPNEVAKSKDKYDLLVVDEAHRLRRRFNLANYSTHDNNNKNLGLGLDGTELDWILKKSHHQILFYDRAQSVRPTDVQKSKFEQLAIKKEYSLITQQRCLGGGKYTKYIKNIFSNNPKTERIDFKNYDLRLYDNPTEMINEIRALDSEWSLCRNIAGFAWPWKTKKTKSGTDIELNNKRYIWNTTNKDWINSPNSVNEIGCIYTTQGYDLNYAGVIIGKDLGYDKETEKLFVRRSEYHDMNGKRGATDEELLEFILNIYTTICTRGMRGTYIYACDQDLQEYLGQFIQKY